MTVTQWRQVTVPRDKPWKRPLIIPPGADPTAKLKPYSRCTTFIGCLENTYNLQRWKQRQTAIGLAQRPDLLLLVGSLGTQPEDDDEYKEWRGKMDEVCEQALEAAEASAAANIGTALHAYTDRIDRGQPLGKVPKEYQKHLKAYEAATADLTAVHIERFLVNDQYQIGGTPDRISMLDGHDKLIITDTKGLALTTPIPTPDGWTTMGQVDWGDQVFASDGTVCNVTSKSEVKRIGTFIVRFDDGSEVVCDSEHLWWTDSTMRGATPTTKTIPEIQETLKTKYGWSHHRVPVAGALQLPDADLPIDPYLLGCWLGDGTTAAGKIGKGEDLFDVLRSDGHRLGKPQRDPGGHCTTYTILGLTVQLRQHDLLGDKHVPDVYLRASFNQRLRLLQGLMDTDGGWAKKGRVRFTSSNKALTLAVSELACTLGQRPVIREYEHSGYGITRTFYDCEWSVVDVIPFRRAGQLAKAGWTNGTSARRRMITAIEPGPDVETACVTVDSANKTYLCGEQMIPTHNSGDKLQYSMGKVAMQLSVYAHSQFYDPTSGERHDIPNIDLERGLVIALNAKRGTCDLVWVDLTAGWEGVELANSVRAWQKRKDFHSPYSPRDLVAEMHSKIVQEIALAEKPQDLYDLWSHSGNAWLPEHTQLAAARKLQIQGATA